MTGSARPGSGSSAPASWACGWPPGWRAGHAVRAWNRTRAKAERLAAGRRGRGDAADAARGADVVICMLSSGPVCDEVLLGGGGALAAMPAGRRWSS